MSDRTFFVRLNLDDMAAEIVGLETSEERGQWLEGFLVGSRGKESREIWPVSKLEGHRFGLSCFHEAESFRDKKSAAGEASANARRQRFGSAQPNTIRTPLEQCSNTARTGAEQAPNQPTTIIQQPTTNNEKPNPPKPPQGVVEVMDLWNEMAKGKPFPQARLTSERQRTIATRLKEPRWIEDFRSALVFVAGDPFSRGENDSGWVATIDYLLRPGKAVAAAEKAMVAKAPISPPAPRQEAKRPSWAIERDIRDEEKRLATVQSERREARDQRNRFSHGQAEYTRYNAEMRKADDAISASEARLVELRTEEKNTK